jgi:hypothetical protein
MAYELKDGQGTLFVNDKEGNDKRPDRRGELNIGGTIYRLSGWIKKGQNGQWLSLSAEEKQTQRPAARKRDPGDDDVDL